MRVLVVGGGGREHALCWRIASSPLATKVWCAPGNAGIEAVAECVPVRANDLPGLLDFARREKIDLTVVGPEEPLCLGLVDLFEREGLRIFGPRRRAAEIEGSKAFCRDLLRRYRIPSPAWRIFADSRTAMAYLETNRSWPVVWKVSGLASGKGVFICRSREEAREAVDRCMERREFGEAGSTLLCEEFLSGEEASVLALTDGRTILPFEPAQDHKRALDGDLGPNTGGMGAISPTPAVGARLRRQVESEILIPTLHALNREGRRFQGILYAGLMITASGPRVLEFNCRLGDPEAQAVLMRLEDDLLALLLRTVEGKLEEGEGLRWDPRPSVCVVAASAGYPERPEVGRRIEGLESVEEGRDLRIFHAGTRREGGRIATSAGRVLGVTALGETFGAARERAYAALKQVRFEGMQYRRDIGERALGVHALR